MANTTTYKQPGLPENWAQMTPQQKREHRLNQFMNPTGIKFQAPGFMGG